VVPQAQAVPTPDRSVRVAWVADAAAMGRVQVLAWQASCRGLLPDDVLDALAPDDLAAAWADSMRRPPTGRHRALVALDGNTVMAFASLGPGTDPDADPVRDAEMTTMAVPPDARGRGHGSRLLAAVADTARADGFARLTTWVFAADDDLRAFLESAGWAPDGAHRQMAADEDPRSEPARQVRMHTDVEDA
jgi:GNAT superfamily N-acetyltransferase